MRYVAVAAGFDGTLARNGRYDERCMDALRSLAATGRKLILVTARELRELLEIFPQARVFDFVIAENGAVMHEPATRQSAILGQAPSEILLQELHRRGVAPLAVGSSIITTSLANEGIVKDAVRKLCLDCQLVQNEDALIIHPADVNKASGVREALRQLGVSAHNLVAIGDAQNDLALFELAEHAVAVANADPVLKRSADRTTRGTYCEGFLEIARDLMDGDLAYAQPKIRVLLGRRDSLEDLSIAPYYDSLLVCGPDGGGKASFCNRLFERLLSYEYQCCVIAADLSSDPGAPAGMRTFGQTHDVPRLSEVMATLENPASSVAVNLAALPAETRPVFTEALLLQLQALHDRVGRPHAVLIHQAHWFLADRSLSAFATRMSEMTMVYATKEPEQLPVEILQSVLTVISLGPRAVIPLQFAGFGEISSLQLECNLLSAVPGNTMARVWMRNQRTTVAYDQVHAIAAGAARTTPELRPSSEADSGLSSAETSSASEY